MSANSPLKRHIALQPISRDHYHSLLLCWKIRRGFHNKVAPSRIKEYADWYYRNHVEAHFEIEETYVFPVLGGEHELVKKALAEHRRLRRLFNDKEDFEKSLGLLEEELESHIRFEERVLFPEVQNRATEQELNLISEHHIHADFEENKADEFWKSNDT